MSFFRKLFGRSTPQNPKITRGTRQRHPLNAAGDFYVERDSCTLCGAPEAEANGLITYSDEGCYFQRQPQTEEEIDRAIQAVAVSCVAAVRYGGTNQVIIKKLHDLNCAGECDHPLQE